MTALMPVGRRADDREPLLGGAQAGLREVLRRAPGAEPGVVGRIEEKGGSLVRMTTWPEKMIS
jgi:hypothetical protein